MVANTEIFIHTFGPFCGLFPLLHLAYSSPSPNHSLWSCFCPKQFTPSILDSYPTSLLRGCLHSIFSILICSGSNTAFVFFYSLHNTLNSTKVFCNFLTLPHIDFVIWVFLLALYPCSLSLLHSSSQWLLQFTQATIREKPTQTLTLSHCVSPTHTHTHNFIIALNQTFQLRYENVYPPFGLYEFVPVHCVQEIYGGKKSCFSSKFSQYSTCAITIFMHLQSLLPPLPRRGGCTGFSTVCVRETI